MTSEPNSTPWAVLEACAARGIVLAAGTDGALKVRAPAGALTPELRAELTAHKAALLALLREQAAPAIPAADRSAPLPLTSAQARLWFLTQLDPRSSAAYNIVIAVRITGPLDVAAFAQALDALVQRHESLRTQFTSAAGQGRQQAVPAAPFPLAEAEAPVSLDDWLRDESLRPFDLAQPPLIRGTLLRTGPLAALFVLTLHHLISDGWSSGVIVRDVAELYAAAAEDRPPALPALAIQFGDYAVWQNARMTTTAAAASLAFWTDRLRGVPVLELPTDRPRPAAMSFRGRTETVMLPLELAGALRQLGRQSGATLFQVLLAGFAVLLRRSSGQTDFAVGTSIANRPHPALEPLIGLFTNTLALRLRVDGDPSFRAVVQQVRSVAEAAYAHAETPLEQIIEQLQPERTLSQNPLFQVCFSLLQAHRDTLRISGAELVQQPVPGATARFDLAVTCEDTRAGLLVAWEYSTDLFDPGTIARMALHLSRIWAAGARQPDLPVTALPLLDAPEREQVLRTWNTTTTPYPRQASIPRLVAEWTRATPSAVAVIAGPVTLTYAQLDRAATRLAHRLRQLGLRLDQAAAVSSERSAEMVVALLAVLKAGGCYLPFDPADPPERLTYLFEAAGVQLMLAPPAAEARLPHSAGAVWVPVSLNPSAAAAASTPERALPEAGPDNLAYITFTSGSTGQPKGICIPHRGVVRLIRDTNYLDYGPALRILELAPVSFDASTFELWGALCNGAVLVVFRAGPPTIRDLAAAIQSERITSLYLTSALFNVMTDEQPAAFAGVRHLLVGGDALSPAHVRRILELHPGLTVINGYGPTETTTFASCGLLRRPEEVGHNVTIGPPISNTSLLILDERLEPVPVGVPGDLYLGGDGNARCYLRLPGLTAESFVPHPEPTTPGERIYRTGDLARWKPDGTAEFLGRKDFQVKIRGFRVEPAEIEAVLALHPDVQRAIVLVRPDPAGKTLVGCVEPRPGVALDFEDVRRHLRRRLPEFMLPAAFLSVPALPLTAHSKIDRGALQRLAALAAPDKAAYRAPADAATQVLAEVWSGVLAGPPVGTDDNFFERGGHSLLATRLMWRVAEIFRCDVPLRTLFDHPTLGAFSTAVQAAVDATGAAGRAQRIARIHQEVSQLTPEAVAQRLAARRAVRSS